MLFGHEEWLIWRFEDKAFSGSAVNIFDDLGVDSGRGQDPTLRDFALYYRIRYSKYYTLISP